MSADLSSDRLLYPLLPELLWALTCPPPEPLLSHALFYPFVAHALLCSFLPTLSKYMSSPKLDPCHHHCGQIFVCSFFQEAEFVTKTDSRGWSALFYAVVSGHTAVVDAVISLIERAVLPEQARTLRPQNVKFTYPQNK